MAAWGWLRHAPWGELARAAARVPDLVRDFRRTRDDEPEPAPPGTAPEGGTDVAQLRFELEAARSRIDKLRSQVDAQAGLLDSQARLLAETSAALSTRLRLALWMSALALIAGAGALAVVLLR